MRRALLLLATLAGCADPITATLVRVEARPAVGEIETLEVTFANDNATLSQTFTVGGRDLPVTFSVETPGRSGELEMIARGLADDGALVALGAGASTIVADTVVDARVLLDPADFVVNTRVAGSQRLSWSTAQAGVQVAAGPDGVFTVGFTDDCGSIGRCDLWGRRFDARGRGVDTEKEASDAQFLINLTDVFGNDPALAVADDGTMLAVWADTLAGEILAVALTPEGGTTAFGETIVSTGTSPDDATVAALPDGRFAVAWVETDPVSGERHVKARLLDAGGQPVVNPETGTIEPFTVDSAANLPDAPQITATGAGLGLALVWRDGQTLRVRFTSDEGRLQPQQQIDLVTYDIADDVWSPRIAATAERRLIVAWGVRTFGGGPFDDGAIVVRRIAMPTGSALGADSYVGRGLADSFTRFGLATTGAAHLVTWHGCGASGDGNDCGVHARVFRDTGLPVGGPFIVNTTLTGAQTTPSAAWLGDAAGHEGEDAFAVTWTDESGLEPDDSDTGIRARIVYPVFADAQGVLGAPCGQAADAACGAGLVCTAGTDEVARCHAQCEPAGPDPDCPDGGICTTVGELSACKL